MAFKWLSNIVDYGLHNDYTYYVNPSNTVKFGVQLTYHTIRPGKAEAGSDKLCTTRELS